MKLKALSVVSPGGTYIAQGRKTIEVRSWTPPPGFEEDLVIVEVKKSLREEGETDPDGNPVAIVRVKIVREYLETDMAASRATRWEPGFYSWELAEVRPISSSESVLAERGIFEIELDNYVLKKS